MRKIIVAIVGCFVLLIGLGIPSQADSPELDTGVDWGAEPDKITYCGYPDGAIPPRDVLRPVKGMFAAPNGEASPDDPEYVIYGLSGWHCQPYPLIWMNYTSQIQKQDANGIMQNYGTNVTEHCGKAGQPQCYLSEWVQDWVFCNENGWYRTKAYFDGWGPSGTPTYGGLTRYSNKIWITC